MQSIHSNFNASPCLKTVNIRKFAVLNWRGMTLCYPALLLRGPV